MFSIGESSNGKFTRNIFLVKDADPTDSKIIRTIQSRKRRTGGKEWILQLTIKRRWQGEMRLGSSNYHSRLETGKAKC